MSVAACAISCDDDSRKAAGLTALPIHFVIPDTQVDPGVPLDHLDWIGCYFVEKYHDRPDVTLIHLGDHWNMGSLSSYDRGKKVMEGRRYDADIAAGNEAFRRLNAPLVRFNALRRSRGVDEWWPRRVFFMGNHEYRRERAIEDNAQLEGALAPFDTLDWETHPFLEPVFIDGVAYCHYFYNPMNGRPYSGMIETRIKNIGNSFTQGHQQGYKHGVLPVMSPEGPTLRHGLIAGSCYLHDEGYLGYQGNAYWRGVVVCYGVTGGNYDPKFVSLDSLCRRYEGVPLTEFMPGIGRGGSIDAQPGEDPGVIDNEAGAV